MTSEPPPVPPPKKSYWRLLGYGCLALILFSVVLRAVGFFMSVGGFMSADKTRQLIEATAKFSPEVQDELGAPIETSFGESKVNIDANKGQEAYDLDLPIRGPKASGHLHFLGMKTQGRWAISIYNVTVDGSGKVIPLKLPQ